MKSETRNVKKTRDEAAFILQVSSFILPQSLSLTLRVRK